MVALDSTVGACRAMLRRLKLTLESLSENGGGIAGGRDRAVEGAVALIAV